MKETGKRILALVMALCLTLALGTTALAAEGTATITVEPTEFTAGTVSGGTITVTAKGGTFDETGVASNITVSGYDNSGLMFDQATYSDTDKVTINATGTPTKGGTITITAKPGAFTEGETRPAENVTATITVNPAPGVTVTTSDKLTAGQAANTVTLTISEPGGNSFATVNDTNGGGNWSINAGDNSNVSLTNVNATGTSATLTLQGTPTKSGTITVTMLPGAFTYQPSGSTTCGITVNAAATPSVSASGSGLVAGTAGTIQLTSSSNNFVSSPSEDLFTVKVNGTDQTVTEAGSGGSTTDLTFTPSTTGNVTIEIEPQAFTFQPGSKVTATAEPLISVTAPTVTATASGTLTLGKSDGTIEIEIGNNNDTFIENLNSEWSGKFTVNVGEGTLNINNVSRTDGKKATLTMDAPTQSGQVKITIDKNAFTIPAKENVIIETGVNIENPTGTVSAALEGGDLYAGTAVSGQTIKLTAKPNLTFADEAKKENFSLVETNDISGLTIEDAKGSGDTVTLTLGGTPSKDGTFKVKAEVAAFKYQPTGAITTEDSITVKPAPNVTLSGTEIVAGNTDKITVSISTPENVKFTKNNTTYFTVSGIDGIATKSVQITGEGKSVEITLSAVPTKDGTLNVTVSKDAFTPVAKGETVDTTVTVNAPSGDVTGSLEGSLTAGTPAGATKIKLSVAGTTLNFKNTLDNAPFTLNGAEGLSIESVAVTDNGKTATLTLSGTPKSQGTFTVTVAETAFVASPGSSKTTTGAPLTINYPTVTVTPDPNFIAEDDETATSIKLKATGSVFNATDEMTYFQISGVSGNITLTGVHADANSDTATLTISGTANGEGTLEITIKPDAFVYKPEGDVKANIRVGKPTGTLTATQNGKLYKGTPVSGQTITVNITESHGLHFKADLTAGDFGLTGTFNGLTIKEAKFVNTLEATLTLEGTPEQNGVFQVKALTSAFHVAPAGEQSATGDITVEDAPSGSVTAALSGPLYAGTPADGTTVTLTATGLTFAAAVKDNFTLTGGFADMAIADAKLSDGKIVLTLSGTPAAAGTFQVQVAQKAFTVYPAADVNSDNITVGAANIKLALSDNGLQAGKENMTFKVTPSGGKLIDLANRAAAIDTGADLDGLTLGDMTQNADGSVTVAIMGMPPVAGSITITFQASMFSPAPEGPVSLTVPVAEGEQAAEPETKPGAPGIGFTAPMDELAASVLTPEEQALYEKGAQVLIELVESPDAQVPEADKTIVTNAAGEYTVGEYLDVSLIKTINGVSDTVSETNRAIRVVFTIPTDLQAAGRQFAVIRVHDGKAEFLKTVSSTASSITVESDRFSTYAIVYREAPATATPAPTQTSTATPAPTDSVPDTGDDTALPGWTALLLGCAAALTAAVLTLRRKDRRG